jgi:hypothetical protein
MRLPSSSGHASVSQSTLLGLGGRYARRRGQEDVGRVGSEDYGVWQLW